MRPPRVTVRKMKYDGTLWGTFDTSLVQSARDCFVLWEPRGTYVRRHSGFLTRADHLRFFFPQQWYAISADYGTDGQLRHCYCDIVLPWRPPPPGDPVFTFIDLELDLHAEPTGNYSIYDEDEFATAIMTMAYPPEVRDGARQALQSLIDATPRWTGPFVRVPHALPRVDLHLLDTASPAWRRAIALMGLAPGR